MAARERSSGDESVPGRDGGPGSAAGERIQTAWEERSLANLRWIVSVRWFAAAVMLAVILFADIGLHAIPWPAYLYGAVAVLVLGNLAFWFDLRRFKRLRGDALRRRAQLQALVDINVLVASVHFAGGVENPFIFLLVFHVTIFSVLFSAIQSFILATYACGVVGLFLLAERIGVPPFAHAHLEGIVPPALHGSVWYYVGLLSSLAVTLYFTAFLVGRICRHFHRERREVEEAYEALRRHEEELERTTGEIRRLLGAVGEEGHFNVRYKNPHLLPCWEILDCRETECPAYRSENLRCWNTAARFCSVRMGVKPGELMCSQCEVYERARPDRLTEIGESFNSVMELLETHALRAEELRSQALEQEKMAAIGRMAAGVAHEVGNPLASISSLVQLLERRADDEGTRDGLRLVQSHVERISETVQQLCNFARPALAAEELVDLASLAEEALRLLSYDRRLKKVQVEVDRDGALPSVSVAPKQMVQVFVNLILNAVDAMPDGGVLRIRSGRRGACVYVEIEDTGMGMAPDIMARIFEPFFTTKPSGTGTGLGLAVSYSTVGRYGGTISVHSEPGEGSTFTVSFPIRRG